MGYSFASTKALLEAGADPNGRMYGQPHGNMTCLAVDDAADLGPRIRDIWAWGAANGEDASDEKTTIFATGTPLRPAAAGRAPDVVPLRRHCSRRSRYRCCPSANSRPF